MFAERRRKQKQDREVCSGHAWQGRLAQTDRDTEGSLASTGTAAPFPVGWGPSWGETKPASLSGHWWDELFWK